MTRVLYLTKMSTISFLNDNKAEYKTLNRFFFILQFTYLLNIHVGECSHFVLPLNDIAISFHLYMMNVCRNYMKYYYVQARVSDLEDELEMYRPGTR